MDCHPLNLHSIPVWDLILAPALYFLTCQTQTISLGHHDPSAFKPKPALLEGVTPPLFAKFVLLNIYLLKLYYQ